MKANNVLLCAFLILTSWACKPNMDNNQDLDFDEIEVNFSATSNAVSFSTDDEIGVIAYCTSGGGIEDSRMKADEASEGMSKQLPLSEGSSVLLKKAAVQDAVVARKGDHNFRFYGVYPYIEGDFDFTAIPMSVPAVQNFKDGLKSQMTLIAAKSSTTVVPTQELEFRSLFSVISFKIARDILEEDVPSTLRRIVLAPKDASLLEDPLAVSGVCNAETMEFIPGQDGSKQVEVDFGESGHVLEDDYTVVQMLVNPFFVPEGGMTLTVEGVDGWDNVVDVFAAAEDNGREIVAGEVVEVMIDRVSDGIVPVEFPVVFPLGFAEGATVGWCNLSKQPKWVNSSDKRGEGYWSCEEQPQAWAQWYWGEKSGSFSPKPFLETVNNSSLKISTVGVKGAWTGDYMEFTIPVKKFAAGSRVQFSIPILCKSSPVFWEVKYLDGEEWKTTATEALPAFDGSDVTRTATWALQFSDARAGGAKMYSTVMTFENAVPSGYLKIRMECVDGSVVMTAAKTLKELAQPAKNTAGTACSGNFYFTEHEGTTCIETQVSFELL